MYLNVCTGVKDWVIRVDQALHSLEELVQPSAPVKDIQTEEKINVILDSHISLLGYLTCTVLAVNVMSAGFLLPCHKEQCRVPCQYCLT